LKKILINTAFACVISIPAQAKPIEFRYGVDAFVQSQGALDALQSISVLREISSGLHFGQSLYSAAAGDAGGLFIGGFELLKRITVGRATQLEFGGFIGGGGGAALVSGNGLMTRGYIGLRHHLWGQIAGTLGLSYSDISGAPVSAPALSFGLSRDANFAYSAGNQAGGVHSGRVIRAIKPLAKKFYPQNSKKRDGTVLNTMMLIGFEASFSTTPESRNETFIQATGAVAGGGEGYADVQLGYRWKTAPDGLRAFAEAAAGFGGGGGVDTGGGFIATAGAGVTVPLFYGFEAEIGAQATAAPGGNFTAFAPYVRAALNFGGNKRPYLATRHWQLTLGLSEQEPNSGFRKPGATSNATPVLVESSLDLFLTEHLYFTGNAQTAVTGDVGGYAVGLLGLGYAMPLNKTWTVSLEGHVGAAGGGGVDTRGGLVGAVRVELDYALRDNLAISMGLGTMQPLRGNGGARPLTLHLGLKTSFTTFH